MPRKVAAKAPREVRFALHYCDLLVEFMGRGYSLTAFAGEIGTSRAKLTQWSKDHPAFAKAVACGQARRARLLEERLLGTEGTKAFDVNVQALKTAAPDEWPAPSGNASDRKATRLSVAQAESVSLEVPDNGRD